MSLAVEHPDLEETFDVDGNGDAARLLSVDPETRKSRVSASRAAAAAVGLLGLVALACLLPATRPGGAHSLVGAIGLDEEEEPCLEMDTAYLPLDMIGETFTQEEDLEACLKRCKDKEGCAHYTFFEVLGNCHITDKNAYRAAGTMGAQAGRPCKATESFKQSLKVAEAFGKELMEALGPKNFTQQLEECVEEQISYLPLDMPGTFLTVQDDAKACRAHCKETEGCKHWTYYAAHKGCHISDDSSSKQSYSLGAQAATRECEAEAEKKEQERLEKEAEERRKKKEREEREARLKKEREERAAKVKAALSGHGKKRHPFR